MLDILFFIIKYIPFWATPIMLISLSFAYVYWIKDVRDISTYFVLTAAFCFLSNAYWVLTGGPKGSVEFLFRFIY